MANIWYLCPALAERKQDSRQEYLLAWQVAEHLDRAGVSFHIPEHPLVFSVPSPNPAAAEAVAAQILHTGGKRFVPVTRGEYLQQAVALGLFPRDTRWSAPMTKEDAAILAAKLMMLLERG